MGKRTYTCRQACILKSCNSIQPTTTMRKLILTAIAGFIWKKYMAKKAAQQAAANRRY